MPLWWEEGSKGGLLVWRCPNFDTDYDRRLITADNNYDCPSHDLPECSGGDLGDPFPGSTSNYAFTMSTTPSSDYSSSKTGFAITSISSTSTTMTANFYPNYWSGTISSNTTWSSAKSPYYIGGDVTITSGYTLTIQSGVIVNFLNGDDQSSGENSSKSELIVNGRLNADNVTFQSINGTKGGWYHIIFQDGCNTNSYLEDCIIEDAFYGVQTYENVTINDTEFNNIDYAGIKVLGESEPTVTDCKIQADGFGLWIYRGSGTYNHISFEGPIIESMFSCVYALGSDNTTFSYCDFDLATSANNGTYNKNSTSITVAYSNMDVPAANYYYMKEISSGPSSIIYTSYLGCASASVDPNDFYGDVSLGYFSDVPIGGAGATWKRAIGNDYWTARELMRTKDYQSAYNLLLDLLDDSKTENKAECLQLAMQAAKKMKTFAEQRELLQSCLNHDDQEMREAAEVWLSILFEHMGELDKAREMVDKTNLTGESKLSMLFNLAAACDDAGFDNKAIAIFEQMIKEFPEEKDEVLVYIRDMNHGNAASSECFDLPIIADATSTETAIAYPNPFNATTKISYSIPASRHVKIDVFNMLGQKVRTLTDAKIETGRHEILWDGVDDSGIAVSSGLYFITADNAWTVKIALIR